MDILDSIKSIIDQRHTSSEGMCGLLIPELQTTAGLSNDELKPFLRKLYDDKYIKVREGLNGKLIFKKLK